MFKLADLQGNILRGYTNKPHVRYHILEVANAAQPGAGSPTPYRAATVSRRSQAGTGGKEAGYLFNIGLTYEGLRALARPALRLNVPDRIR